MIDLDDSPITISNMEVAEHELDSWYIFTDGNDIYLDVRTGLHGTSFWLLFQLNDEEIEGYQQNRKTYPKSLAKKVLQRPQYYFLRNTPIDVQKVAFEALKVWRHGPKRPKVY